MVGFALTRISGLDESGHVIVDFLFMSFEFGLKSLLIFKHELKIFLFFFYVPLLSSFFDHFDLLDVLFGFDFI